MVDEPKGNLVFSALRGGKYFLLSTVILALAVSAVILVFTGRRYTSTASVLPSPGGRLDLGMSGGGFADIGMVMGTGDAGPQMSLYPDILKSRKVGIDILRRRYSFREGDQLVTRTLLDHLGAGSEKAGLIKLSSRVSSFWIDRKSRALVLSVTTDNPRLSALVVNAYLERLERFNREERRSSARDTHGFVREKFDECTEKLQSAEEELGRFIGDNRDFAIASDPMVLMRLRRFQREVEIGRALRLVLGKQMRKVSLEVERDTPILNVLDYGVVPGKPSWPVPHMFIISMTMGVTMAALVLLVVRESFGRWRMGRDRDIVEELICELRSDLARVPLVGHTVGK